MARATTIDIHPDSGYLIFDRYAKVADRIVGDSIAALGGVRGVDIFLHDSLHTFGTRGSRTGRRRSVCLTPNALVLSDNAHATDALMRWAEQSGRQFSFFRSNPWGTGTRGLGSAPPGATGSAGRRRRCEYPGLGFGAAWRYRECGSQTTL